MIFAHQRSDQLAEKLRENWLIMREKKIDLKSIDNHDDSLTNLAWLQSMNISKNGLRMNPPPSVLNSSNLVYSYQRHVYHSSPPKSHQRNVKILPNANNYTVSNPCLTPRQKFYARDRFEHYTETTNGNSSVNSTNLCDSLYSFDPNLQVISIDSLTRNERIEFRTNFCSKPSYSYTTLIFMALESLKNKKTTLADIISWICENFSYFKKSEINWQLDLRQCLSFSNCFQKVPKRKEEPHGYGDIWRLNPRLEAITNTILKPYPDTTEKKAPAPVASLLSPKEISSATQNILNEVMTPLEEATGQCGKSPTLSIDWLTTNDFNESINILMNNSHNLNSSFDDNSIEPSSNAISMGNEKSESFDLLSDQTWHDEQLNLEELDNIFGLNNDL